MGGGGGRDRAVDATVPGVLGTLRRQLGLPVESDERLTLVSIRPTLRSRRRDPVHGRATSTGRLGSYHARVSRRADPERIHQARRAAIRNRLLANTGMDPDVAERWCDAWEAEAALRGLARNSVYWDAGRLWIDAQCAARKRPSS